MTPREYCRDRAAPPGSSFYYSTLYHPEQEKRRLFALFAFCGAVEESALESSEPELVHLKVEWWQNQVPLIRAGQVQHPVSVELKALLGEPDSMLDTQPLQRFVDGFADWLAAQPPDDYAEWIAWVEQGYGEIWRLAAALCGVDSGQAQQPVRRSGALLGAFEQLQHLRQGLRRGQCILPSSLLQAHGLTPETLAQGAPGVDSLLRELLKRFRADFDAQQRLLSARPLRRLLFCRTMLRLAAALCSELERDPTALLRQRTALTPVRKFWIAWRTKLGAG